MYFSLAASEFAPVHLAGSVGHDGLASARRTLAGRSIDVGSLEVSQLPTFRWQATHDFESWVTAQERSQQGSYAAWAPRLSSEAAAARVLFLGSMLPELQAEVLRQSQARLVGADSMTIFIGPRRPEVVAVAEASDLLFLNRSELRGLVPEHGRDWRAAARSLCGRGRLRGVVVKGGPEGAAVVTATQFVELPAAPVATVVDPTGAGDALAGGFLGACARAERDDEAFFSAALDVGVRCAAAAISAFGVGGLLSRVPA